MRAEFSEFSYSFALTRELMNAIPGITSTPLLPSTREEGRLGYDLRIPISGVPVFIQFKLADYLRRTNSKYIRDGYYNSPYYRINIYKRHVSNQHNILWNLAREGHQVYYTSPTFHLQNDFNKAFIASQVINYSSFFSLSDLPYIYSDDEHHIVFLENDTSSYYWHPNYKCTTTNFSGAMWLSKMTNLTSNPNTLGIRYALKMHGKLLKMIRNNEISTGSDRQFLNQIAERYFWYTSSIGLFDAKNNRRSSAWDIIDSPEIWDNFDVLTQSDLWRYLETEEASPDRGTLVYEQTPTILQDFRTALAVYCGVEPLVISKTS